ncbi:hypothetical protein GmHk_14G041364 [Glycine max]|nr:hypothetical protein GmHk_14G041364 [Glycine max]
MVEVVCLFMQRRWKNTLKLRFLSQKIQEYRRRVFIYAEKVEEYIKAAIFISKNPRVQRRWKNTLKLRFLSKKLHEYRFITERKNGALADLDDVGCFKYYAKLVGRLLIAVVFLENLWNFDLVLFFISGFDFDFL